MKKEKRTMGVAVETDLSECVSPTIMKAKKKKRKNVGSGECAQEANKEHSVVVDTSPDKKRKRGTDNNKTKNSSKKVGASMLESEEKKKVGSSEAAAKRKMKAKKRAKRAAKKAKKEERKSQTVSSEADAKAETLALEYLQQWSSKKDEWSFQKVRQVWLLQHMYDTRKMSAANFAVMLKYIDGLKGNARSLTVTKGEKLFVTADSSDEEEEKDDDSEKKQPEGVKLTEEQEERVRAVLQMLA